VSRQVDAILFDSTGISAADIDLMERYSVLSVYIGTPDEIDPSLRARIPCVTVETEPGGRAVGRHFLELGHRSVACIAGQRTAPPFEDRPWPRVEGFRRAMREAGAPEPVVEWTGGEPADGYRAAAALLAGARAPTAIFAGNDFIAIGVLRLAADRGLRVPEDIAVCGFDDIAIASFLDPRLTTVRIPKAAMGQRAARIVLGQLDPPGRGRAAKPDGDEGLTVELVVRESTDRPRRP
jgi:DNA-binding LacI/PurR family transcriptional regulator